MNQNYKEFQSLKWDEIKIPKILNLSILSLIVISILIGQYFVPFIELWDLLKRKPLLIILIPVLLVAYIAIHELIHGILMKYYSGIKPQYGYSGPFIFAKSGAIFNKKAYFIITLAPMIILGIIFGLLNYIIIGAGVWFVIFLWIINLYASRGDLQAVILLRDIPSTYGIKDKGDSLTIYRQK